MIAKFNNGTKVKCIFADEAQLYREQKPVGWLLTMRISGNFTSEFLEKLMMPENISKIGISDDAETKGSVITGYSSVNSITLSHNDDGAIAEVRLKREHSGGAVSGVRIKDGDT